MDSAAFEVSVAEVPRRRLLVVRGFAATDYFSYCDEVGCDVYDDLMALPGRRGEPMGLWLPEGLRKHGTSEYVMGVEIDPDFGDPIADVMDLPAQTYLVFQGPSYAEEEAGNAIGALMAQADAFDPSTLGLAWSTDAPRYQLAPIGERGYIEGRPVTKLNLAVK